MELLILLFVMQITTMPLVLPTSTFLSPNCPSQCGDVSISSPFGVGSECARPGFELTCRNHSTHPPMLFYANQTNLQIKDIYTDDPYVFATSGIAVMPSDVKNYNVTSIFPNYGPLYSSSYDSYGLYVTVIGCGILANLILKNVSIGQCETFCYSKESLSAANGSSCANTGCCQIPIRANQLTSDYMVELKRENKFNQLNRNYSVKAFISMFTISMSTTFPVDYSYTFNPDDLYYDYNYNSSTRMGVLLRWNIPYPHTCELATQQTDYACLAKDSYCLQDMYSAGYHCSCLAYYSNEFTDSAAPSPAPSPSPVSTAPSPASPGDQHQVSSNPYIPGGCNASNIIIPNLNCRRKCGDFDIPFPFGLSQGCYRNAKFKIFCNTTTKPVTTFLISVNENYYVRVDEILIEEGKVRVDSDVQNIEGGYTSIESYFFYNGSTLLEWVIDYKSCDEAKNMISYACISNQSSCVNTNHTISGIGYYCRCTQGYQGNPYIIQGCKDINECEHPDKYICNGSCYNYEGGYKCCPHGTFINPTNELCIPIVLPTQRNLPIGFYIGLGFGIGLFCLFIIIGVMFLRRVLHKRIQRKLRQKYFRQNHGLLLQQLIACNGEIAEKTKIFTFAELEKATSNFDQSRIIGRGGHGTVFKGLLSDQRVVAIKKSKLTIKREIDQFINEVVILSGISHRNIVKLFGCCLETEVPLLVYEFISNGTLHKHLHESTLSWEHRLRIASEIAGALNYLHSAASISIFHRDVKSANILLDEYLTSKVSDFGASRSIPIDQTQVATAVQGTYGYLDPEYHHTGRLTEKSDVYSFGVILVEILTGQLPISSSRVDEERYLSVHFLRAIDDNKVLEIVEDRLKEEATTDELIEFINLAEICLKLRGDDRPTMKEVEFKLQSFRMNTKQKNEIKQENERLSSSCASRSTKEAVPFPRDELVIPASENQSISLLTCPR